MKFEFISKIELLSAKEDRARKTWVNIGIVFLALSVLLQLFVNRLLSVILLFPLLFLLSVRAQLTKKQQVRDVGAMLELNEDEVRVTFQDTLKPKKGTYLSQRFIMKYADISSVTVDGDSGFLFVKGAGTTDILDADNVVVKQLNRADQPCYFIPEQHLSAVVRAYEKHGCRVIFQ